MEEVIELVKLAGSKILEIYKTDFLVSYKGKNDPVTKADLLANEIISSGIQKLFPAHAILSEENLDDKSRLKNSDVWILDPIDGTKSFIAKDDDFAISLGYAKNQVLQFGIVHNPAKNELFVSSPYHSEISEKKLETHNRKTATISRKLAIVSKTEFEEGIYANSFLETEFEIHSIGSIAYKLGLLSHGLCDLVISLKPKNEWDIAGGIAVLLSKGFEVLDCKHFQRHTFNNANTLSYGIIAGKKELVSEILEKHGDYLQKNLRSNW